MSNSHFTTHMVTATTAASAYGWLANYVPGIVTAVVGFAAFLYYVTQIIDWLDARRQKRAQASAQEVLKTAREEAEKLLSTARDTAAKLVADTKAAQEAAQNIAKVADKKVGP